MKTLDRMIKTGDIVKILDWKIERNPIHPKMVKGWASFDACLSFFLYYFE